MTTKKIILIILGLLGVLIVLSVFLSSRSVFNNFPGTVRDTVNTEISDSSAPFLLKTTEIAYQTEYARIEDSFANIDHPVLRDVTRLAFSPDGTRVSFLVYTTKGGYVYVDNMTVGPFSAVSNLKFSNDSSQLAFVAGKEQKVKPGDIMATGSINYVKLRGDTSNSLIKSPPLAEGVNTYGNTNYSIDDFTLESSEDPRPFYQPVTSSHGETASIKTLYSCHDEICLRSNERQLIITDPQGRVYKHKSIIQSSRNSATMSNINFSPDGNKVAYITGKTPGANPNGSYGSVVVVANLDGSDTTRGESYDEIADSSIKFSADGKYIGYGAHRGGKIYWVVEKVK